MVRSTKQKVTDERRFPVKVRVKVPEMGFGKLTDEMHNWLRIRVGQENFAIHGDNIFTLDAVSIYMLDVRIAADFMDEFDFELAEWVMP